MQVLNQSGSELAGPAFSPDGSRLYVSSQRGGTGSGITYEIAGPFRASPPSTTTTTTATTTTVPANIVLSASGRTVRNRHYADLSWTGATTGNVEIRRNDVVVATTANDGAHTDNLGRTTTGTFRYRVSHPGGSPTSNEVSVTF
jgi:secreted PhoX family phosphatase